MIRIVGQFLEDEKIIELYWVRDQRAITCSQQKYGAYRSEERRVGKECRSRWSPYH